MSLIGSALMGAFGGAGQAAYEIGKGGLEQKRRKALEKMRQEFDAEQNRLANESRERATAAEIASNQIEGDLDRKNRLEVAGIQAKSSSTNGKLDPRIASMVGDIDAQLKPLYDAQSLGEMTEQQTALMQQLQLQRSVLLGGGIQPAPGPEKKQTTETPEVETPEPAKDPSLLEQAKKDQQRQAATIVAKPGTEEKRYSVGTPAPETPSGDRLADMAKVVTGLSEGSPPLSPEIIQSVYDQLPPSLQKLADERLGE